MTDTASTRNVYQVSELVAAARELLEHSFPLLWVEGEVSNLARPRSGHWYLTLKDEQAQVRCAMFANRNRRVGQPPEDGDRVQARARVSLYPARGDFQLIIEHLEDAGAGELQRAFEALRNRLAEEGLFDDSRKRPTPAVPRCIGVITSATGAALRDVLSVLRRRYPAARVVIYPTAVQGANAAGDIVRMLERAGERGDCDVLLLVRGGGSLEDLQSFSEEAVARAIRACPIPVISGVGHEVDITIADFAADVRAATPSAAAEMVCPDLDEWHQHLDALLRRSHTSLQRRMERLGQRLASLRTRLARRHPARTLEQRMQRVDELEQRLRRLARRRHQEAGQRLHGLTRRLRSHHPSTALRATQSQLAGLQRRLGIAVQARLGDEQHRWRLAMRALDAVSPLNTLTRGYAIVRDEQQCVITDAAEVHPGDDMQVQLRRGGLECRVTGTVAQASGSGDKV
ncbi:exodeoxyribonuclease VII large subunit [Spectribacter hydrogenoxidans]|uniref:Exodeoxyribonuclease 7 large subunit n=1 Tax=Spectribacter hydrogenoxidans TaxID=3075608 RepID=A0ABU3BYI2_9GAMM|nr:exodeoxyribonuclease VII large subunit [Salinisphaera sp. W335]MDT0634377.1 exodeoxyribonuclease VII large subunit [Salinisphaera sp. W335]